MLFMNEYDIEMAKRTAEREDWKVTVEATEILDRLREWTDQNSDGWAYWPKPCRAAAKLQERIQEQERRARDHRGDRYDMTYNERDAALRPIKAFFTRENVSHDARIWILDGVR